MSITALPQALSDKGRAFAGRAHQLPVAGEHRPAQDGRTFETLDPATGRTITTVAQGGAQDVDAAVTAARNALGSDWSRISAADRGLLLNRFAHALETHADELAELESLDNGKPVKLAKVVDVASAVAQLRHCAGWP